MSVLMSTDGVLGSVAQIADRDPAAAAVLVQLGLFEALTEQIETVRTPMTKAVLRNMEQVSKSARRQLEHTRVSKGEVPDGYEQSLDVLDDFISKGLLGTLIGGALAAFNREHPRDKRGRFVSYEAGTRVHESASMDERHEHHVVELAGHRDRMKQANLIDDDTIVHVGAKRFTLDPKTQAKVTGDEVTYYPMKAKQVEEWAEKKKGTHMPVELSVRREHLKDVPASQLAAVDLAQLATGEDFMSSRKLVQGVFDQKAGGKVREFGNEEAQNWYGATEGTNRQTYRRIKTLGQGLSAGAPMGHPLNTVGNLAQLMGDIGPEAEKVLGPGIRRTAYRYRGTERRPEMELYKAVERTSKWLDDYNDRGAGTDEYGRTRSDVGAINIANAATDKDKIPGDYAAKIAASYAKQSLSDDERDLRARGGVAVASLLGYGHGDRTKSRLPDMQLTELSLASGEVPPSEGVIIDAEGHVVSQAVGYNGDHYLPFDLRNLGRLHGGQYVRTRASGGPTTEDIYTSLVTGTRQIQVVSNSGVFTMEFDPDLRGVRRFNDKVSRMVERYGSMLAAIHDPQSELYENDLPPETMRDLRTEASAEARGQEDYQNRLKDKIREERWRAEVETTSWEEIEQWARSQAEASVRETHGQRVSGREREALIEEAKNDFIDNETPSVRKLKLDGTGYFRAMRALKQEFPYYIRNVDFRPLPEWLKQQGLSTMGYKRGAPSDKAYVAPGQTNTATAMVGGSRSARRVQTGRAVTGLTRAEGTYGTSRKPAEKTGSAPQENAPATPGTQGAPAAPGARQATGGGGEQRKVDYTSLLRTKVSRALHPIATTMPGITIGGMPQPDENAETILTDHAPRFYAHYLLTHEALANGPGREGETMAEWLLKADDLRRSRFLGGLEEYINHPDVTGAMTEPDQQAFKANIVKLRDAEELLHPYATLPTGRDPEAEAPVVPKPYEIPMELPEQDAPDEQWMKQIARLDSDFAPELGKGAFLNEVTAMGAESQQKRFDYVLGLYDAMEKKIAQNKDEEPERVALAAAHRAWSFLQARKNAERRRGLAGGDAGPKVQKADSSPPAGDPFLLSLRAELDQLIADGLVAG
ncbi:MAG TPA: hypothetical protein VIT65_22220 [Microlunatus sp.]